MEQTGLYDLELSLFNGDMQLVGLDASLTTDQFLFNENCDVTAPGPQAASRADGALKGELLAQDFAIQPVPSGCDLLDSTWLNTRVDLQMLDEPPTEKQLIEVDLPTSSLISTPLSNEATSVVYNLPLVQETTLDESISVEDLFDSMVSAPPQSTPEENIFVGDGDVSADNLLMEVLGKLTDQFGHSANSADKDSVLSPVSVEDVEHLLSGPSSPAESSISSWSDSTENKSFEPDDNSRSRKRKICEKDNVAGDITDKKLRKKIQNKTAALRYRQKKKIEKVTVVDEVQVLEERNTQLKDQVDSISREIKYLKDLMSEVQKAKGLKCNLPGNVQI